MPNLIGNILKNFRDTVLHSARKLNANFFRKGIFGNKMGILLQFKCLFHEQSYSSIIVIHVQLYSFKFSVLVQETGPKKKTGNINLINTWLALLHKQHISKIKLNSPDSIQKCVDELIC